jgi:uncharacterized protein (TIGR02646 family)
MPQEAYTERRYLWSNLLASCQGLGPDRVGDIPVALQRHCGAAKDNWFDEDLTVDPQHKDVERLFRYLLNGEVHPLKSLTDPLRQSVEVTIARLKLNSPTLVSRRKIVLDLAATDVESLSPAEWHVIYLEPDQTGALQEFWPALKYNYERIWS